MPETGQRELKQIEPNHVLALDGLRGVAILLVLLRHFEFNVGDNRTWWMRGLADAANSGYIGVDLFFVLSGFLITGILYNTLNDSCYFKNFYMRRFLRIFPLYYGYIFVLMALSHPLHIAWNGMVPVFLCYLQNVFLVRPYTVLWYYTGQLWSLAVEEQFYIVWPLLIFFIRDRRRLIGVTLFLSFVASAGRILLLMHGVSSGLIYTLTPCRMDALLIGSWTALAMRGPARLRMLKFSRPVFLASILLYVSFDFATIFTSRGMGYAVESLRYSVISIGFAALLVMALNVSSLTARFCRLRPLRWLGKYSYGIYVIHLAILHAVNGAMGTGHTAISVFGGGGIPSWAISLISAALSLCLAWISYNFYELHFLKLKKYFSYNRPPRQPELAG